MKVVIAQGSAEEMAAFAREVLEERSKTEPTLPAGQRIYHTASPTDCAGTGRKTTSALRQCRQDIAATEGVIYFQYE